MASPNTSQRQHRSRDSCALAGGVADVAMRSGMSTSTVYSCTVVVALLPLKFFNCPLPFGNSRERIVGRGQQRRRDYSRLNCLFSTFATSQMQTHRAIQRTFGSLFDLCNLSSDTQDSRDRLRATNNQTQANQSLSNQSLWSPSILHRQGEASAA